MHIDVLKLRTKCARCGQVCHCARECVNAPDARGAAAAGGRSTGSGGSSGGMAAAPRSGGQFFTLIDGSGQVGASYTSAHCINQAFTSTQSCVTPPPPTSPSPPLLADTSLPKLLEWATDCLRSELGYGQDLEWGATISVQNHAKA